MLIISNFCDFSYDKHFPHSRSLTPTRWPWNFPCLKTQEAPVHTFGNLPHGPAQVTLQLDPGGPRSGQLEVLSWQAAGGRGHQHGPGWQSRSPGAHTPGQGRAVCREQVTWAESQSDEAQRQQRPSVLGWGRRGGSEASGRRRRAPQAEGQSVCGTPSRTFMSPAHTTHGLRARATRGREEQAAGPPRLGLLSRQRPPPPTPRLPTKLGGGAGHAVRTGTGM